MDQFGYYQNYQYANVSSSRVYVNRNFNRHGPEGIPTNTNSNVMYLNPNFSNANLQLNVVKQRDQTFRPSIHVNPNFMRPKSLLQEPIISNSQEVVKSTPAPVRTNNTVFKPACNSMPASVRTNNTIYQPAFNSMPAPVRTNNTVYQTACNSMPAPVRTNNTVYQPACNSMPAPVRTNNTVYQPACNSMPAPVRTNNTVYQPACNSTPAPVRTNNTVYQPACNSTPAPVRTNNTVYQPACNSTPAPVRTNNTVYAVNECQIKKQAATVAKSRYCLVRQKENMSLKSPLMKTIPKPDILQTVKINKYKIISLNVVKKNLQSAAEKSSTIKANESSLNQSKFIKSKYRIKLKPLPNDNLQNTRFKFIKSNCINAVLNSSNPKQSTARRVSITLNKSILKSSFRNLKLKFVKGAMKINNIPCPLYTKYGKCLRLARGSCHYLHDKKHVSICRKFVTGVCHDHRCLLSHDLTDKKMPTCYFYLQGNCTKEGCPYLHVKLNEKTKICPDFVKGYCEKGDQCLCRHVNVDPAALNITTTKKVNSSAHNMSRGKADKTKVRRKSILCKQVALKGTTGNNCDNESTNEHRYFKDKTDDATSSEPCDLIKPTRCKLGTLPSFIQL